MQPNNQGGAFGANGGGSGGYGPPAPAPGLPQPAGVVRNPALVRLLHEWYYCQQLQRPAVDVVCIPSSIFDRWSAQAKNLVRQLHG